jgi:phosphoglycolate phosphatase-like HAD superfamily hydrolase
MANPAIEVLRPDFPRGRFRLAVFDFDGTLSLLREGWPAVMAELMREELGSDSENDIDAIVVGMNGRPTIVQMQALAAVVADRSGRAVDPVVYAREYQRRLLGMIGGRYDAIRTGCAAPAAWAVPGIHAFLEALRARGVALVLASGSEMANVRRDAEMLKLTQYFEEAFFAPLDDDPHFTKRAVIEELLKGHGLQGDELIGFGDGVVETEEVRRVGGVAIAVASEEPPRRGVNAVKRERLMRAGADVVIADYECRDELTPFLFGGK